MTISYKSPYRSHITSQIELKLKGTKTKICGWLDRLRDHGGLRFLDVRDHYGIVQCVVETGSEAYTLSQSLSLESVVMIEGTIIERTEDTINSELSSGYVEIKTETLSLLSASEPLPMPVNNDADYPEDIRFKHRYLDLRRKKQHDRIILRSKIISYIRKLMDEENFLEIQTPLLTASSPEGARDFIIPSRLHSGKFYALPQAPQMFKQMLMTSGFDRYYQIAPCFRDEDARSDRSPGEFYQLDLEMAYVGQEEVLTTVENIIAKLYKNFSGNKAVTPTPFPRITYAQAMSKYGSDKPDLRNSLEIVDVSKHFKGSELKIFTSCLDKQGMIRAIKAPLAANKPRSWFDKLNQWARDKGQAGLGYIIWKDDGASGPLARHLSTSQLQGIKDSTSLNVGDAVFFIASTGKDNDIACQFASLVRTRLAELLNLIDTNKFEFCWIIDYPMYEKDSKSGVIDFSHNPFSMPQGGIKDLEEKDPLDILAWQYDIVCNGIELSSGAIRNHEPETLIKAFSLAGYSRQDVEEKFTGILRAFTYGAPPHGGSAPGIDRMVMMLADCDTIRDVIPFPLNQMAQDLLMGAPTPIDQKRLKDLSIKTVIPKE